MPKRSTASNVKRATIMTWRSVASRLMSPLKIFVATAEPEMRRYDEDELIAAAKMPDTTNPQKNEGSSMWESTMNTLSAAD